MISNFTKNKYTRGFTLLEALVAISIFTVSILALMNLLSANLADINYSKKKITAAYLAQEGVEYMRNLRDTFVLFPVGEDGWREFKEKIAPCVGSGGCYFDPETGALAGGFNIHQEGITRMAVTPCVSSTCPEMRYDDLNGRYGYIEGTNSGFVRSISIEEDAGNGDRVQLFVTVSWEQGSGDYEVTFSEDLFNWAKNN